MHGLSVLQHLAILQLSGAFRLTAPLLRVTAGGRISHSAAATVGGSVHMLAGAAGNMQPQTSFDFFGMLSEVEAQFSVFDLNDDGIIEVDEVRNRRAPPAQPQGSLGGELMSRRGTPDRVSLLADPIGADRARLRSQRRGAQRHGGQGRQQQKWPHRL